jgi:hypothetical protein
MLKIRSPCAKQAVKKREVRLLELLRFIDLLANKKKATANLRSAS